MSCPDFDKRGLRFLFRELDSVESKAYQSHIKACPFCKRELAELSGTIDKLKPAEAEGPSQAVRSRILHAAHSKRIRRPVRKMIAQTIAHITGHRPIWRTAFAAGLAILLLLVIRPLVWPPAPDPDSVLLAWDDDFISEALSIHTEIKTLKSGGSLGESIYSLLQEIDEVDWTAPSTDDFESIRNSVDLLKESIGGI